MDRYVVYRKSVCTICDGLGKLVHKAKSPKIATTEPCPNVNCKKGYTYEEEDLQMAIEILLGSSKTQIVDAIHGKIKLK